jgi:ankyrin repeat protein
MSKSVPLHFSEPVDWRNAGTIALLVVALFTASTLAFLFSYRNDLLILASAKRNPSLVKTLVWLGAHAKSATDIFPEPALIEYLLALQSPETQLSEALSIAIPLLDAGAKVGERNAAGWTPLMLAAASGKEPLVELLVKKGAGVDDRAFGSEQTEGLTALMAAAMNGHSKIVRFLIERGAGVNHRTRSGFTALLLAASRGHLSSVEALIEKGASIPGPTVQVAERNGHEAIVKLLRQTAPFSRRAETQNRRPAKMPEE